MKCPLCVDVELTANHQAGIEIDVCPRCGGIWLDRGELQRLAVAPTPPTPATSAVAGLDPNRRDDNPLADGLPSDPPPPVHDDDDDDEHDDRDDDDEYERGRKGEKRKKDYKNRKKNYKKKKRRKKEGFAERIGDALEDILDL